MTVRAQDAFSGCLVCLAKIKRLRHRLFQINYARTLSCVSLDTIIPPNNTRSQEVMECMVTGGSGSRWKSDLCLILDLKSLLELLELISKPELRPPPSSA